MLSADDAGRGAPCGAGRGPRGRGFTVVLLLAGSLVGLAGLAAWWSGRSDGAGSGATPAVTHLDGGGSRVEPVTGPPPVGLRGAGSAGPRGDARTPSDDGSDQPELVEQPVGILHGRVLDGFGEPVPRAQLRFVRTDEGPRGLVTTFSDREGSFELQLPAGTWRTEYLGDVHNQQGSALVLESVQVPAHGYLLHDLLLPGSSDLVAAFVLLDQPDVALVVELRPALDPERVVAEGWCVQDPELAGEAERAEQRREGPPGLRTSVPQGRGFVHFQGLAAELYELHVCYDVARQRRKVGTVDLSAGSVRLEPVGLVVEEFFRPGSLDLVPEESRE